MMIDHPPQIVEQDAPKKTRFALNRWILLFLFFVLLLVTNLATYFIGKNYSNHREATFNSEVPEMIENTMDVEKVELVRVLPALDRYHNLYVTYEESHESCEYGIVDITGFNYDSDYISNFLDTNKIACKDDNFSGLVPAYLGWLGENSYAVETESGVVSLINISEYQLEEVNKFEYDSNAFNLIGISKSPNYFLVYDMENNHYKLLDINKNTVLDNIGPNSYSRGAFYDEVNDGFVFVNGEENSEGLYFVFDFLSVNDLSLRNVLTTLPMEVAGRGCYGDYLVSDTVGQIKFVPGCIDTHDQYKDDEGNIVIDL